MKQLLVVFAAALLLTFTVSDEAAARGRGAGGGAPGAGVGAPGAGVGARGVGVGAPGVGVVRHPVARGAVRRCAVGVTCY
jgi:hypothetical protein